MEQLQVAFSDGFRGFSSEFRKKWSIYIKIKIDVVRECVSATETSSGISLVLSYWTSHCLIYFCLPLLLKMIRRRFFFLLFPGFVGKAERRCQECGEGQSDVRILHVFWPPRLLPGNARETNDFSKNKNILINLTRLSVWWINISDLYTWRRLWFLLRGSLNVATAFNYLQHRSKRRLIYLFRGVCSSIIVRFLPRGFRCRGQFGAAYMSDIFF